MKEPRMPQSTVFQSGCQASSELMSSLQARARHKLYGCQSRVRSHKPEHGNLPHDGCQAEGGDVCCKLWKNIVPAAAYPAGVVSRKINRQPGQTSIQLLSLRQKKNNGSYKTNTWLPFSVLLLPSFITCSYPVHILLKLPHIPFIISYLIHYNFTILYIAFFPMLYYRKKFFIKS